MCFAWSASRLDILRMVLRDGLRLVISGIARSFRGPRF